MTWVVRWSNGERWFSPDDWIISRVDVSVIYWWHETGSYTSKPSVWWATEEIS